MLDGTQVRIGNIKFHGVEMKNGGQQDTYKSGLEAFKVTPTEGKS